MQAFREITRLRKGGDLSGARRLAREALAAAPGDRYLQNAFGWVLYEELKRDVRAFNSNALAAGALARSLDRVAAEYRRLEALKKPDLLHSLLFQFMVRAADEWPGFIAFARWWGFDSFRDEDRLPLRPTSGGKPLPSLEMRALYAVGKALARGDIDGEHAAWGISTLDASLRSHPDDVWLNYYRAKVLVGAGKVREALRFLQPVVTRNITAAWVWGLLAQIIEADDRDRAIICCYRAVKLARKPAEVIKTRVRLARLLAHAERFPEAARQVRQAYHDRQAEGWAITQELAGMLDSAWFRLHKETAATAGPDVEPQALEVLCGLFPEGFEQRTGVLESHNAAKELAYIRFSAADGMPLPYRLCKGLKKLPAGTVVSLAMSRGNGRARVLSLRVAEEGGLPDFMRQVSGDISIRDGRSYGFIGGAGKESVFVEPGLISRHALAHGAPVSGIAVRSVDRKTGREGWKLLALSR